MDIVTSFVSPHFHPADTAYSRSTIAATMKNSEIDIGEPSLLQSRLLHAGVPTSDMEMRSDSERKRLQSLSDEDAEETKESSIYGNQTVEIKTLVWEVTCHQNEAAEGCEVENFHVVTALKMEDKVDLSLLRDLVYWQTTDLPFGCTPSRLSMAPRHVAESLTGFQSGCMPPICHTMPMQFYLEASIASSHLADDDSNSKVMASIGSGILGQSLLLPLKQFMNIAEHGDQGVCVGSFIQSSRPTSPAPSSDEASPLLSPQQLRHQQKQKRSNCLPEPKDRLKEYKKFSTIEDKAKLLRTTARKKGRFEDMEKLIHEAVSTGDFPELFQVHPHKNALHLSAWRGDFETVQLLVETSKAEYSGLDIVNMISMGEGNYGKTPIFFALTQCRDDVVRFLISEGASLLIVNNKGQTPCSIAVSHLEEESCNFLFDIEANQLREGGTFVNYRTSHSDNKFYGDLDPRFEMDSANMGEDAKSQFEEYEQSAVKCSSEATYDGIPTQFSPRSIRPTVRWWNREDRSLESANENNSSGQITFTQPRASTRAYKEKHEQPRIITPSPTKDAFPEPVDIESLEFLTIDHVLDTPTRLLTNIVSPILVNCWDSIRLLESEIDECIGYYSDPQGNEGRSKDEILVNSTWGLDCEWKPGVNCGLDNPVATLQLSTRRKSFLVDLQSLCQQHQHQARTMDRAESTEIEALLCIVLSKLFASTSLPVLGFGILQDLGKLAGSFPHMSCFLHYHSVMDLQSISSVAYPRNTRQAMSSLQKMVATLLHKRLDKTQQCSDWTTRPLSTQQLNYAALDATVLPLLLKTILEQSPLVERYDGQLFSVHTDLQSSLRYTLLDISDNNKASTDTEDSKDCQQFTHEVPMGSIKRALGRQMARQCWPTTDHPTIPELPKQVLVQHVETNQRITKKERDHLRKVGPKGTKRPKPVQLKNLSGNLDNLPVPGMTLGYTKDSCVTRVVGHEFMNTLPEGTYIGFNRRSGVVETDNAWIIFCNFGGSTGSTTLQVFGRHSSEFSNGGRELTFQLNPTSQDGRSSQSTLFQYLSSSRNEMEGTAKKKILLFARGGTKSKYIYCGICECQKMTSRREGDGPVDLLLRLEQYEELIVGNNNNNDPQIASDFLQLVESRQQVCQTQI
jgi:hypothetical protein